MRMEGGGVRTDPSFGSMLEELSKFAIGNPILCGLSLAGLACAITAPLIAGAAIQRILSAMARRIEPFILRKLSKYVLGIIWTVLGTPALLGLMSLGPERLQFGHIILVMLNTLSVAFYISRYFKLPDGNGMGNTRS